MASTRWPRLLGLLVALLCLIQPSFSVKEHDFKKCDQSGFCKRNRAYADSAVSQGSSWASPYAIIPESVSLQGGQLQAIILKTINAVGDKERFPVTISFLQSGVARVSIDEEKRQKKEIQVRHNSPIRKERYNEAEKWVIVGGLELDKKAEVAHQDASQISIRYGPESNYQAIVSFSPFEVDFRRDDVSHIKFNNRGLLNMEHWRPEVAKPAPAEASEGSTAETVDSVETDEAAKTSETSDTGDTGETGDTVETGEDESTWWDETFGGNTDSKPRGPESMALDITFVEYEHVYGIPEHTGPLSLKQTRGGDGNYEEPYRLYNSDVFEYILDSPMTLYGAIPLMQAHKKGSSVGVFWLNAAETWVDIVKGKGKGKEKGEGKDQKNHLTTQTHWISEAGILDVFVFLSDTPQDLNRKYGELTGTTAMPQEFAIGYHQCRWNYISDDDVKDVDRKMDKSKIPYDVIWLDIEYTDDRKYFTWEPHSFADPMGMGKQLQDHGRKLVVIIDPHIKSLDGYKVSDEMASKDLAIHNKDGQAYEGWCWPGSSNWVDCFNPKAIEWWKTLFKYDAFKGTMENTFIWNDMNEPSVFNGPETTMPKDNIHFGGWEHRDLHNLNGLTFHNATFQALLTRKKGELRRPFVLTRSFYAGSQRLGAMWTGDNQASWDHLEASIPMTLNQGISGFPFAGADVGGFFGNPDRELITRWYQAGAFYPFFRGHAHIDSRRREPYLLGDPHTAIVTAALRLRYSLLPAWYTAFFHAHRDGSPIVRPMFWTHPAAADDDDAAAARTIDDQMFLGATGLLVKPVVARDAVSVDLWIPDAEAYYDYFTYERKPTTAGQRLTVPAALHQIPLLMRGGHIFPRRDVPRRSIATMRFDDYTLVVAVSGQDGTAEGELYADDGDTFQHEKGQYIYRRFRFADGALSSVDAEGRDAKAVRAGDWLKAMGEVYVDRVVIVGAPESWDVREVQVESEGRTWAVKVDYHAAAKGRAAFAIVGRVGARIGEAWKMYL